jgi:3-hydroxyacyl-[acyl-carrier-protein] dehydratase
MTTIIKAIEQIYTRTPQGARYTLPPAFPAFEGHFPQNALLPAVVQIELALYAISKSLGREITLKEVKKAKFTAPVLPGDTVDLIIACGQTFFDISIKNKDIVLSSFRIIAE